MNNQNGRNYLVFLTEIILTSRNLCISLLFLITEIGMETIDIILSKGRRTTIDRLVLLTSLLITDSLHCKQTTLSRSSFHRFSRSTPSILERNSRYRPEKQTNSHETKLFFFFFINSSYPTQIVTFHPLD